MEIFGYRQGFQVYDFSLICSFVTTAVGFISLPVAGRVGIIRVGRAFDGGTATLLLSWRLKTISQRSPGYKAPAAIILVASMALPPPSPIRNSASDSLQIRTPFATSPIFGFGLTPKYLARVIPSAFSDASIFSITGSR